MIRVLIVEDDPFISLDIADQLADLGFSITGVAATVADALALFDRHGCDVAVLDVNLGPETAAPVAAMLTTKDVPFVTVTGYSPEQCPPEFRAGAFLGKPVRVDKLAAELRESAKVKG